MALVAQHASDRAPKRLTSLPLNQLLHAIRQTGVGLARLGPCLSDTRRQELRLHATVLQDLVHPPKLRLALFVVLVALNDRKW